MTDDRTRPVAPDAAPTGSRKAAKRVGANRPPFVAAETPAHVSEAAPLALAVATTPEVIAAPEPVETTHPVAAAEPPSPAVAAGTAVAQPITTEPPAEPALPTQSVAEPAAPAPEEPMMDNTTTTTTAPVVDARAMFTDLGSRAKDAMEKGSKMFEEMNAFGKGNVEAIVESGKIAAKGIEALGQEAAMFTRKSLEGATEAMKSLAATRSPTEFLKLQSDYARSMFDAMVAETSRSTEAMIKLANDVAQPISNRVALAADRAKMAA